MQSLISRGCRADTIYIKLPMLNVSLLAMAFAIITRKRGGRTRRLILILYSLVTRLYNNVYWDLNRPPDNAWWSGREKKHLYNISY